MQEINADDLRGFVRWLGVSNPVPTRKDDMVAAIGLQMSKGYLIEAWKELNELEKSAVSEALHNSERCFNIVQFKAKYGKLPNLGFDRYQNNQNFRLRQFLYSDSRYGGELRIPKDLSTMLMQFVPQPMAASIDSVKELPEVVTREELSYSRGKQTRDDALQRREMEFAASQDLFAVLRLIEQGQIAVSASTRRPTAAAIKRISAELFEGDYFEPEVKKNSWDQVTGPVKAFAWPMLLQAAKLAALQNSKLVLTKKGKAAVQAPAAETLHELWGAWKLSSLLDEFSRIDTIKGQFRGRGKRAMTNASVRRAEIVDALRRCPVGEWIQCDDFSRFMQAIDCSFEITSDYWTLYLSERQYDSLGYSGYHEWHLLQGRYIQCLLFEYLSTLGMIDVAYTHPEGARIDLYELGGTDELKWLSQYDGLEYFRITPLGAYCLGMTEDYEALSITEKTPVSILPNRLVQSQQPLAIAEKITLETYAEQESELSWRLAIEKIAEAVESGQSTDDLREFLAVRHDQPLPETVDGLLRTIDRNANQVKLAGDAVLVECASEDVAKEIIGNRHVAKICMLAGKKHLVYPAGKAKAFRKAIHALGYSLPWV